MNTTVVRGMATRVKQTADRLDLKIDMVLSHVERMEWESNARSKFEESFRIIHRNIKSINEAMRLMGKATDAKVAQWEAIANKFRGPFLAVGNFWQSAIDHLGTIAAAISGIVIGSIGQWILPWRPKVDGGTYFPMPFPYPGGKRFPRIWPRKGESGIERTLQGPSWRPSRPDWLPGSDGNNASGGIGGASEGGVTPTGTNANTTVSNPSSGPRDAIPLSRTPNDKLSILGGCTNYVATKRDVSGFWKPGRMNAHFWDENAREAGFQVGSKPVAGSIMVLEADRGGFNGIMDVDDSAGHVLFVEGVQETNGGYLVSYSHAGTLYDDAGKYIPGTFKMLNNSKPVFVPYDSPAVSFIYDRG